MPKKVLFAVPPSMLAEVDYIAQCEHRTRSDLIREALRRYIDGFRAKQGVPISVPLLTVVPDEDEPKKEEPQPHARGIANSGNGVPSAFVHTANMADIQAAYYNR